MKSQEHVALQQYVDLQLTSGYNGLIVGKAGFLICEEHPFLGVTTPNGYMYMILLKLSSMV